MSEIRINWPHPRVSPTVRCPKLKELMPVSECWATEEKRLVTESGSTGTKVYTSTEHRCEFFDHIAIGVVCCNHPDAS